MTVSVDYRSVLREIATGLRSMGFTGSGSKFKLPCETCWIELTFQKLRTGPGDPETFVANVQVSVKNPQVGTPAPLVRRAFETRYAAWCRVPLPDPDIHKAQTWTLQATSATAAIVIRDITAQAVPWINEQRERLSCS